MKRNFIFLSLLILGALACDNLDITPDQTDSFIKFFSNYSVFTGADVKQIGSTGGYVLLGTAETNKAGKQICLIITDEYGNYIDSTFYGFSEDDRAYCLQVLSDDGFAILGSTEDTVTLKRKAYFIRTNSEGATQWTRVIEGNYDIEALHFEVAMNGSFYLIGYADTVPTVGEKNKEIWLSGLDSDGNELWWSPKKYKGEKDDIGTYLQILDNGDLVLTGKTCSYGDPPSANGRAFMFKVNSSGSTIAPIYTFTGYPTVAGTCLQTDDEENIYLTGTVMNNAVPQDNDIMLAKVKYNSSNIIEVFWVKNFENTGNDYGTSLSVDHDEVTVLGTVSTTTDKTSISMIATNADGYLKYARRFGLGSEMTSNTIEKTDDNGFIISGTNKQSHNNMTMTLIKTKANGSF